MSKWEDIVKDKLGGYESNLPEDSLAAFHARRATAGATKAKRFPLVWAIVPAIAAGLAAVLLLRKPTVPEEGIQMIPQPMETYSQVDDRILGDDYWSHVQRVRSHGSEREDTGA